MFDVLRLFTLLFTLVLCFWKESNAYDKGKALVVSKVPLPDYRADLDERHGSTQKEVIFLLLNLVR